jgi:flagellar protein FliL
LTRSTVVERLGLRRNGERRDACRNCHVRGGLPAIKKVRRRNRHTLHASANRRASIKRHLHREALAKPRCYAVSRHGTRLAKSSAEKPVSLEPWRHVISQELRSLMANAELAEDVAPAAAPAPKKGGKKMMVIGLVAVLALCGGGFFFMHSRSASTASAAPKETPKAQLFLPLDPAFVVNFADQDSTRYLQVGVTVMSHDPDAIQAMKDSDPVIRNALVMLFSSQTYAGLSDTAGKEKLQAQALAAVRKIVADKTGKPDQIDALYFTSFVMQ